MSQNDPIKMLEDIVGFPAKDPKATLPSTSVFATALEEVKAERDAILHTHVKDLITQATAAAEKLRKSKEDFERAYQKEETNLVKVVKRISAMAEGKAVEPEKEETTPNE